MADESAGAFGMASAVLHLTPDSRGHHCQQSLALSCIFELQVPEKLQSLFQANYDLLLSIFNPEGWLDITYVDQDTRIGRDDKGNVFVLARAHDHGSSDSSSS